MSNVTELEQDIMVSVMCITYNHERYIRQCLESLVSQKTSFRYEVVVHDDCSTDGTADIIREFEEKYPGIIRPIYQKENQYQKRVRLFQTTALYARGKYVAFCEGDDYWCDNEKLQIQVDYMESHPKCSICFHNVNMLYVDSGEIRNMFIDYKGNRNFKGPGIYTSKQMVRLGVTPISSVLHRREDNETVDNTSKTAPYEDVTKTLWLACRGYGYCCEKNMSVYRVNVPNSSMSSSRKGVKAYNRWLLSSFESFEKFDIYTNYKYHKILRRKYVIVNPCYIVFKKERLGIIRDAKEVYIYGAGRTGEAIARELMMQDIPFNGFVVSDGRKKRKRLLEHDVFYLSEVSRQALMIPAVTYMQMETIGKKMKKAGFTNICEVFERRVVYPEMENQ